MPDARDRLNDKIEDMGNKARRTADTLTEKAEAAAGRMVGAVTDKAEEVAAGASQLIGKASDKAQEAARFAVQKAETIGEDLTGLIRRYPWQALLAGFGAGFLIAQVLRRQVRT